VRDGFDAPVALDEVGESLEVRGALIYRGRGPRRKGGLGGADGEVRFDRTGACTSANFHVQSSGERSSKVREEAMRSPLM